MRLKGRRTADEATRIVQRADETDAEVRVTTRSGNTRTWRPRLHRQHGLPLVGLVMAMIRAKSVDVDEETLDKERG